MALSKQDKDLLFLVVDDQFNVRRMIVNFLRTFGFHDAVDASDGQKALEIMATRPIGFVISDWNMPRMNGLELLKKVRSTPRYGQVPFLMITAEVVEEIVAEAVEEGVDDYIVKPFHAKTLNDKIEMILDKRRNPPPLDMELRHAAKAVNEGEFELAEAHYRSALDLNPESPRAHLGLGEALEGQGDLEGARQEYEQAVKLSGRFVKAHDRLAGLAMKQGDSETATLYMQKAAKVSPRNAQRQMSLGKALMEKGDKEAAVKALNKAREVASADAELASEVGEILLGAGLNKEAAEAFTSAVQTDPNMVHIYNRLGIAYRRQKRFAEAIEQYQLAIKASPTDENLFYNIAVAQAEAGQREASRRSLSEALRLKPDFSEARELLKRLSA